MKVNVLEKKKSEVSYLGRQIKTSLCTYVRIKDCFVYSTAFLSSVHCIQENGELQGSIHNSKRYIWFK